MPIRILMQVPLLSRLRISNCEQRLCDQLRSEFPSMAMNFGSILVQQAGDQALSVSGGVSPKSKLRFAQFQIYRSARLRQKQFCQIFLQFAGTNPGRCNRAASGGCQKVKRFLRVHSVFTLANLVPSRQRSYEHRPAPMSEHSARSLVVAFAMALCHRLSLRLGGC